MNLDLDIAVAEAIDWLDGSLWRHRNGSVRKSGGCVWSPSLSWDDAMEAAEAFSLFAGIPANEWMDGVQLQHTESGGWIVIFKWKNEYVSRRAEPNGPAIISEAIVTIAKVRKYWRNVHAMLRPKTAAAAKPAACPSP